MDELLSSNDIHWEKIVEIYVLIILRKLWVTMMESMSQIKDKSMNCKCNNSILQRYVLFLRKMSAELIRMLNDSTKFINYIKSQPLEIKLSFTIARKNIYTFDGIHAE